MEIYMYMQYVEMVRKEVTDATESGLNLSAGQKLLRDWCMVYSLKDTTKISMIFRLQINKCPNVL